MITIQTRDSDGDTVVFDPAWPPTEKADYTIREVDGVPPKTPGDKTSVLRWQSGALAWVAPTLTPQQTFAAAVAAGYTVPGITPPLVLPMDDAARNLLHQLSYQLLTMETAGRIASTDQFPVTDLNGEVRLFSAANIQTMIMGLGEAYLALWASLHAPATPAAT